MNRSKSYRLLIILLFIAFISLISRSLIYLIISITIAFIIILLLSKDKARRLSDASEKIIVEEPQVIKKKNQLSTYIVLSLGVILLSYGIAGYFHTQSIFNDMGILNDPFLHTLAIIIGGIMTLSSFVFLLKKYLEA
ncbi:MAG: hypothetical protein LRY73_00915 [Bacillus sp. (in: Bacteria)]|nr:hypothetical protein [Bacillus sp. (in: firmicutes)]